MGATNDFVSWATAAGNNCMSQSAYLANPAQQVGVQVGLADPTLYNKATRQANFIAAALAQFVANNQPNNVVDNGNQATFLAQLQLALYSASSSAGMQTITGAAHTFVAADEGLFTFRSNSGTLMLDTLPGTGPGVLPAGIVRIENGDATALYSVAVGSGATLDGVAAGYIVLGPGQQCVVQSSGTNYYTLQKPARVRLAANTSFYVDMAAGNDANEGLSATTGAWKTLQVAADWIGYNVDINSFIATLQATGAFTAGVSVPPVYDYQRATSGPNVAFNFASGASITATNSNCISVSGGGAIVDVAGHVVLAASGIAAGQGCGLSAVNGGELWFGGSGSVINFGVCAVTHLYAATQGLITTDTRGTANYTISGSASVHAEAIWQGQIQLTSAGTVTVSGTPAFATAFAYAVDLGLIEATGMTFSGSATGKRYSSTANSVIDTSGGGATYLPGDSGGSTATGGIYL